MEQLTVAVVSALGAGAGVVGGVGGAVLIVPLLVLTGLDAPAAATAGLLAVATGTATSAPRQLAQRLANHRLGVTIELGAGTGVVVGTLLLSQLPDAAFRWILAGAIAAAVTGALRPHRAEQPAAAGAVAARVGETPGALAGAYRLGGQVVPYRVVRAPVGVLLSIGIGLISGVTGTSGGYLKTPMMREVMQVPIKVAAATTTFASGLTALAGLAVLLPRTHLAWPLVAAVILGGALGGIGGARLQAVLAPRVARRVLSVLLIVIMGVVLWPA